MTFINKLHYVSDILKQQSKYVEGVVENRGKHSYMDQNSLPIIESCLLTLSNTCSYYSVLQHLSVPFQVNTVRVNTSTLILEVHCAILNKNVNLIDAFCLFYCFQSLFEEATAA